MARPHYMRTWMRLLTTGPVRTMLSVRTGRAVVRRVLRGKPETVFMGELQPGAAVRISLEAPKRR